MRATSLLFLILCSWWIAKGQNFVAQTQHYTTKDGLSSNEIYAIHKDARGLIWIGTRTGLDLFDGQKFEHYAINVADAQAVAFSDSGTCSASYELRSGSDLVEADSVETSSMNSARL